MTKQKKLIFAGLKKIYTNAEPAFRRRLIGIISFLLLLNALIWTFTLISSRSYPVLLGLVTLAYTLGLRHAVDADHIAAIDNTTRKLMQDGKRSIAVGFFFSLGHSTIVILLSVLVAFSSAFVKNNLPYLKNTGALIGTSVSSIFLLLIGIINLIVLIDIIKMWRKVTKGEKYDDFALDQYLNNRGFITRLLKPILKTVTHSWNMYFVGFLFGLGFDTASEIALISISAATGVSGMPIPFIILLPLAFTAGMSLIDTLDGILMLGAYGWAYLKPVRKLYYNMTITFISVVIALFIGSIEGMQILISRLKLSGGFFDLIETIDFDSLGYIIIAAFILSWLISIGIYKTGNYDSLEK